MAWLISIGTGAQSTLDPAFNPVVSGGVPSTTVSEIALQPDGRILIAGRFTTVGGEPRSQIARLYSDGTLDATFNANPNGAVRSIAVQPDGKILIGGEFTQVGGQAANFIARLNADGTLDAAFNPNPNGSVSAIANTADGKILIGGDFTQVRGQTSNYLARLNADGTLDTAFNPGANGHIWGIAIQSDGKVVVLGLFDQVGGQARAGLARLNSDLTLDTSYTPEPISTPTCIALQPDGKLLVGLYDGTLYGVNCLKRLNTDGSLDSSFSPYMVSVYALTVEASGCILVSEGVSNAAPPNHNWWSVTAVGYIPFPACMSPQDLNLGAYAITVQPDGNVLIGGGFTQVGGQPAPSLVRVLVGGASQSLATVGDTAVRWMRWGGPELDRVWFESSSDMSTWAPLGEGVRISGGWEKGGLDLPCDTPVWVRARGAFGAHGSQSLIESVQQFNLCGAPSSLANSAAADIDPCADTGVRVSWSADPGDWGDGCGGGGARTYDVLRDASVLASDLPYGTTEYTDTTGAKGVSYSYAVRYANRCGGSSVTTGASVADIVTPPPAPVVTGATGACEGHTITWTGDAPSFNVLRGTSCGTALAIFAGATSPYTDTTAVLGTVYYYWVVGVNACGESAVSNCVTPTPPPAPVVTGATGGCAGNAITWTGDAPGFNIMRGTSCGTALDTFAGVTSPYTDTTAVSGTPYSYWVVGAGCALGPASNCMGATRPQVPGVPSIDGIEDDSSCSLGITIAFTAGSGATSHELWVDGSLAAAGISSPCPYTPGDTASHSYVIRAVNGACLSDSAPMNFSDAMLAVLWRELVKRTAAGGAAGDHFGYSVALEGDTAVIGAYSAAVGSNASQGAAYILSRHQGGQNNWGEVKKLIASDGAALDHFGTSVSVDGDTIVVGLGRKSGPGAAYIFYRDQGGPDNWGEVKKLTASDGSAGDMFGRSVSIAGDAIGVGAIGKDSKRGAAYIFYRDQGGADNWGEVKKLVASDGAAGDYFGASVSVDSDTAVVGASEANSSGGASYIFSRNLGGLDNWGEGKKLVASDGAPDDSFGASVSVNLDTAVVGAYGADSAKGASYIFSRNLGGTDNWGEVKKLTASDGAAGDRFGYSVSGDGDAILIGAYYDDVGSIIDQGAAYVFSRDQGGPENWGEVVKLTASDGAKADIFGCSVAVDGETIVAGAELVDAGGNISQGAAYIFQFYALGVPEGPPNNTASDPDACADTGVTVAWAADPADWKDCGSGPRTYSVLRDGSVIASGIAYGTTTFIDDTGDNGTTYMYKVHYVNDLGNSAETAGAPAAETGPPSTTGASRCGTGTVTLGASGAVGGQAYKWYDAETGGTLLQSGGTTYTTPSISATTTYFVSIYDGTAGCESPRTAVTATVHPDAVGNLVWRDDDADGIQDAGEPGLAGVVVDLYDGEYNWVARRLTNGAGQYRFQALPCGETYLVKYFLPSADYRFSPADRGGDDLLDSDADPATGQTPPYAVGGFDDPVRWDCGMIPGALCIPPDEPCWVYQVTRTMPDSAPILHWQDWNQPSQRTGWNVRRSNNPALPKSTWPVVASNIIDGDAGTPNYQWTDISGADPGPGGVWYYQVTAFTSYCPAEGPF